MINHTQRIVLGNVLPTRYTPEVILLLNERGIVNKKGNPFRQTMISMVFNGFRSNQDIEKAIFDVAQKYISTNEQREKLLGIKKPAVDAAGS